MGRCCRCQCTPINFRCFDPDTGGVNWEDYLYDPIISRQGNVYSLVRTRKVTGTWKEISVLSDASPISLPARNSDEDSACSILGVQKQDGSDGTVLDTLDHFTIVDNQDAWLTGWPGFSSAETLPNFSGMEVSAWRIYDDELCTIAPVQSTLYLLIEGLNDGGNTLTYHFRPWIIKAGTTLTLSASGTLATNDATFDVDDSKANIEAAITSAFNATNTTVTSVTVSHWPIYDGPMSIEIEFVDSSYYLDTIQPTYASGNALSNGRGNCYAQDVTTGEITGSNGKSKHSSSYLHDPIWDSDGNVFRIEADSFSATTKELASWDTSTDPWAEDWTDATVFSKTPINEDEESSIWGIGLIKTAADNGWCAIAFSYTSALQDVTVQRMSVLYYENDGTNETDVDGNWQPTGLCSKDDGTAGSPVWGNQFVTWRDVGYKEYADSVFQTPSTDNRYHSWHHFQTYDPTTGGSGASPGETSTPTIDDSVNLADFSSGQATGFDGTRAFFASTGLQTDTAENQMEIGTRLSSSGNKILPYTCGEDDSDIIDPDTLVNLPMYEIDYTLGADISTRAVSGAEWRLVFERILSPTSSTETAWFDDTTTLAQLNSELSTLFGSDNHSPARQNVEASYDGAAAMSGPLHEDIVNIQARCATDEDHEDVTGFPSLFTAEVSSTPDEVFNLYNGCVQLTIEFKDAEFSRHRTDRIGAITLSTGADDWTRQFGDTDRDTRVRSACLCRDHLFVLADRTCSKLTSRLTLVIEMTYSGSPGAYVVDITLTVTNNGPNTVVVDAADLSITTSNPVGSWSPSSRTITSGSSATFTNSFGTLSSGTYTSSGTATGTDQTTSDSITSNEASEEVVIP